MVDKDTFSHYIVIVHYFQEPAVSDVQSEISDVVQPTTEADLAIASDVKQSITSQPSNGSLDKETASSVPVSKPSVDSCVHDVVDASAEDTDVMKPDPEAKSSKPVPPATTAPAVSEGKCSMSCLVVCLREDTSDLIIFRCIDYQVINCVVPQVQQALG